MSIRNRFAEALAAGRAAVADAVQSTRTLAALDPAISAEDVVARLARVKPAMAGQKTLLLVASDSLGLYRIENVVTEYLPLRALDAGSLAPHNLGAELYAARRLGLVCTKWNVDLIEALDAATAARLAVLRGYNGDSFTVANVPEWAGIGM